MTDEERAALQILKEAAEAYQEAANEIAEESNALEGETEVIIPPTYVINFLGALLGRCEEEQTTIHINEYNYVTSGRIACYRSADGHTMRLAVERPKTFDKAVPLHQSRPQQAAPSRASNQAGPGAYVVPPGFDFGKES